MIELEEKIGNVSKGLTSQQIEKLKCIKFNENIHGEEKCTICICEFEKNENINLLKCKHIYH